MQVRVLLFAALKEAAGARELSLELPEPATVAGLRDALAAGFPKLAALLPNVAIALNEEYATPERAICPGDELALIPPVSGG